MTLVQRNVDFWLHPGKLGKSEPTLCLYHPTAETGQAILDLLERLGGADGNICKIKFDRGTREQA